jgi:hypothetical protein
MKIYDASLAGTVTTVSGSTSNLTGSFSGSFSGSYVGNGSGLFNIPASGVTGLELNKIVDGGINATISATQGLRVNTDTIITGSLTVTGNLTAQQFIVSSSVTHLTTSFSSGSTKFGDTIDDTHQFTGSVLITGSLSVPSSGLVSGSSQITYGGLSGIPSGIVSGSVQVDVMSTTNIARLATTGSNTFIGTQTLSGSLNVSVGGSTELQVNAGGVNIGNALTDNHVISGSVLMTGSLTVGGAGTFSRNINSTGEGTFMGLDAQAVPRLGFVKIAGAQPFLGFGGDTFTIRASNGSTIATSGSFTTALAITTAGNVGIGTSSPSVLLHISSTFGDLVKIEGSSTGNTTNYYSAKNSSGDTMQIGIANTGYTNGSYPSIVARGAYLYSPRDLGLICETGFNMLFQTGGSERMRITSTGVVQPGANGTQDLGTTSLRWGTIYTSDLSLSNGIGDYTIVEGEEKLYLYNNKNNKVYSFVLQEEDPLTATPKKS